MLHPCQGHVCRPPVCCAALQSVAVRGSCTLLSGAHHGVAHAVCCSPVLQLQIRGQHLQQRQGSGGGWPDTRGQAAATVAVYTCASGGCTQHQQPAASSQQPAASSQQPAASRQAHAAWPKPSPPKPTTHPPPQPSAAHLDCLVLRLHVLDVLLQAQEEGVPGGQEGLADAAGLLSCILEQVGPQQQVAHPQHQLHRPCAAGTAGTADASGTAGAANAARAATHMCQHGSFCHGLGSTRHASRARQRLIAHNQQQRQLAAAADSEPVAGIQ